MKKFLLAIAVAFALIGSNTALTAQTTALSSPIIWGSSPFQDSLWAIDTTNWTIISRIGPTLPGYTITGMNGIAMDPTTGITYMILKVSGVSGRVLATIDLPTGVCTSVTPMTGTGNLGDNFSSITFDTRGQLYGATGDGATVSEALYKIDKATAVKTLMFSMGNGADGEIICYNPLDSNIYHWSGNGTVVMEKFMYSNLTYTPTNIPTSGSPGGETFGMMYNGNNKFIVSNISSNLLRGNASGVYGSVIHNNPDDLRGLVMLPYFTAVDSICFGSNYSISGGGHATIAQYIYNWGDGSSDTLMNAAGVLTVGNHMYASTGTMTVTVEAFNGIGGDTVYTTTVVVNPLPVVSLGGFTTICSGDSTLLVANTAPGTYQWYMDGGSIAGATNSAYMAGSSGIYNLLATNAFGCSDSAAVGLTVITGTYPVVGLLDDTACGSFVADAGNPGSSYVWSTGDTTQMATISNSATVIVTVTGVDGCSTTDSANYTINPVPSVTLGPDTSVCESYVADAGSFANASYLWCNGATTQTNLFTFSGPCAVMVIDTNGCVGSDTINVTILGNPTVALTSMMDSTCMNTPPIPLFGSPAGGTFSGPGTTANTFTPSVAGPGVHDAVYMFTDTNGCSGSDTVTISVFANPVVTASAAPATVCADDANVTLTGTPSGGSFTGTSVTGNQFDPSVGAGTYAIVYVFTDANGCAGNDSTSVQVNACVGIEEENAASFSIYPNPSTGILNLNVAEASVIEVMDVLGNVVVAQKQNNAGTVQIDLSSQPNGVYFVRVNEKNIQRVVIQK